MKWSENASRVCALAHSKSKNASKCNQNHCISVFNRSCTLHTSRHSVERNRVTLSVKNVQFYFIFSISDFFRKRQVRSNYYSIFWHKRCERSIKLHTKQRKKKHRTAFRDRHLAIRVWFFANEQKKIGTKKSTNT